MSITFSCDCGLAISVRNFAAGKVVQCPGCGGVVRVPHSSTAVSATPSAPVGAGRMAVGTPMGRAVVGALVGSLFGVMALSLLYGPGPLGAAGGVALVVGATAGAILMLIAGPLIGDREIRGKAGAALMGGAIGAVIGVVPAFFEVMAFIGSPRVLMLAFCGPIIAGAVVGGIIGRVRHGGQGTIAELSGWVAVVACALAIVRALRS